MSPLTERLLAIAETTVAASRAGNVFPCVECNSTQYDEERAVYIMVGQQLLGHYCRPCYFRCFESER